MVAQRRLKVALYVQYSGCLLFLSFRVQFSEPFLKSRTKVAATLRFSYAFVQGFDHIFVPFDLLNNWQQHVKVMLLKKQGNTRESTSRAAHSSILIVWTPCTYCVDTCTYCVDTLYLLCGHLYLLCGHPVLIVWTPCTYCVDTLYLVVIQHHYQYH